MRETEVIERIRLMATDPAARGLLDDAAVLDGLVITHDTIAEGVHFLPADPPASVGWKLVAVNLSDLAAKGATPWAALLSLTLVGSEKWTEDFLVGVEAACERFGLALVGGDTIALPPEAPRVLGLTAIGRAGKCTPDRAGGKPGDELWLIGTLGDSAAGLAQLRDDRHAAGPLVDVYHRPIPQMEAGRELAPLAHAMMDVSDGLLIDARRMAGASACEIAIELNDIPLSAAFIAARGGDLDARLFAATGGDDYALLVALPPGFDPATISLPEGTTMTRIGALGAGEAAIALTSGGAPVELPEKLGHEHCSDSATPVADGP